MQRAEPLTKSALVLRASAFLNSFWNIVDAWHGTKNVSATVRGDHRGERGKKSEHSGTFRVRGERESSRWAEQERRGAALDDGPSSANQLGRSRHCLITGTCSGRRKEGERLRLGLHRIRLHKYHSGGQTGLGGLQAQQSKL